MNKRILTLLLLLISSSSYLLAQVTPTINITSDATNACNNSPITYSAQITNGGPTPFYQWKVNGINVGGNTATYVQNAPSNGNIVSCTLTSSDPQAVPPIVNSNAITLGTTPTVVPTVVVVPDVTNACANATIVFTAVTTDAGSSPTYQWKKNGTNVGYNSDTFATTGLITGDIIICSILSSSPCASPITATNSYTILSNTVVVPTVSIVSSATQICPGTSVTFTATTTGGAPGASYQWKINGVDVGTNITIFTTNTLTNGAIVLCVFTSNNPCALTPSITSNTKTIIVKNLFTPTVAITVANNNICVGATMNFTATGTITGNAPVYNWKVNGLTVFTGGATFNSSTLTNNDIVTCTMVSNSTLCISNPTVNSNALVARVRVYVTPVVTITTANDTVCGGKNVVFTSNGINGGNNPVYQWLVNGVAVGTNNSNYFTSTLPNNAIVSVVMNSSSSCLTVGNDTSNVINMTVIPTVTPDVIITATDDTICNGTNVTFNATIVNGGLNPLYEWRVNGVIVGNNSNTYSSNTLTNNSVVRCYLTTSAFCFTKAKDTSNKITITVLPPATPNAVLNVNDSTICIGANVIFTANPIFGGTAPGYQWFWNGLDVNTNTAAYNNTILENGDSIFYVVTSNAPCLTKPTDTSNYMVVSVTDNITPAITITPSITFGGIGNAVTYTATTPILMPYTLQWYRNGVFVTNTTTTTWNTTMQTNYDSVYAIIINFTGCYLGNGSVTSNMVYVGAPNAISNNTPASFVVYPNPVADMAIVKGAIAGDKITLYDVTGKIVSQEIAKDNNYNIDMHTYAKGAYQAKFERNNQVWIVRLIKE
jgi:Secretion system C-terminal sorting domain